MCFMHRYASDPWQSIFSWRKDACAGDQGAIGGTAKQVQRLQVAAIELWVWAMLLHHEHIDAQFQQIMQLAGAELIEGLRAEGGAGGRTAGDGTRTAGP